MVLFPYFCNIILSNFKNSTMKNILFITCWYPFPEKPWKSYFVKEHALAIAKQGYNLQVYHINVVKGDAFFKTRIFERENELREIEYRIITRFDKKLYGLLPVLYRFLPGIQTLHQTLLKDFQPDLLHANVVFQAGEIARILSKKCKLQYLITEHLTSIPELIKNPLFRNFINSAFKKTKAISVVSDFHKRQILKLKRLNLSYEKLFVIPNVVRPHLSNDTMIKHELKNDKVNFLMIVNIRRKKHQAKKPELAVEGLIRLKQKTNICIRLVLIGGGIHENLIKQKCKKNGIEFIQTGFIPKEQVYEYYKSVDFLLHPSKIETFSLVVAEALLFGVPCAVSNNTALVERIKPFSGLLINNTEEEWARGIYELVYTSWDREKIKNYYKDLYTPETVGHEFDRLYKNLSQGQQSQNSS